MRAIPIAAILACASLAHARGAHVTATTRTTIYIDAGTADGLAAGASWRATIDGRAVALRVAAAASHDAVLELDGPPLAVGAVVELPPGLTPPQPVAPRPPPAELPAWRDLPDTLDTVQAVASREQPARIIAPEETVVAGELALSVYLAADTSNTSTSWQDVALSSQLAIASGAWRYDHVLELHAAGSPELFSAPLQHAQAEFDVYLLRLAYSPVGAGYAAALGRQPGAALGELGTVDGGTARVSLGGGFDLGGFAGVRPAADLALAAIPRGGADLGYSLARPDGTRARLDVGAAVDEFQGALDRAQTAAAVNVSNAASLFHADGVVDLSSDAAGQSGPRLTRANGYVRHRRGRVTGSLAGGYDKVFYDRALFSELPDLVLGPRTFIGGDATYALQRGLDLGTSARVSRGDGFTSGYADVVASWYAADLGWRANVAPHAVVGSFVDELGVRGGLAVPIYGGLLDVGGSFDRVWANGERAWAGLGRVAASRPLYQRWRTALSVEVATGDGPTRFFAFALLGYRLGR